MSLAVPRVWYLRGMVYPIPCEYKTTRGAPCRRKALGEWHRCWQHGYGWWRKTDREHVQPRLLRWQVQRRGNIVHRDDVYGRGFLRFRSQHTGLLYHKGYVRPPRNAWRFFVIEWWQPVRRALRQARTLGIRRMFTPPARTDRQLGVSPVLIQVIEATRATLIVGLLALAIVIAGGLTAGGLKLTIQYGATAAFLGAWMIVKNGIIQARPAWRQRAWHKSILLVIVLYAFAGLGGAMALWATALGQRDSGSGAPGLLVVAIALWLFGGRGRRRRGRRRWWWWW